VISNASA